MYGVVCVQWNEMVCGGVGCNVKFGAYNMVCLMYFIMCGRMYVCWCIFVCGLMCGVVCLAHTMYCVDYVETPACTLVLTGPLL